MKNSISSSNINQNQIEQSFLGNLKNLLMDKLLPFILLVILLPATTDVMFTQDFLKDFAIVFSTLCISSFGASMLIRRLIPSLNERALFSFLLLICTMTNQFGLWELVGIAFLSLAIILLEKGKLPFAALAFIALSCIAAPPLIFLYLPVIIWLYQKKTPDTKVLNTKIRSAALIPFCVILGIFFVCHIFFVIFILGDVFPFISFKDLYIPICCTKTTILAFSVILLLILSGKKPKNAAFSRFLIYSIIIYIGGILFVSNILQIISMPFISFLAIHTALANRDQTIALCKKMDLRKYRRIHLVLFLFFVFLYAWNCDDAYHSFIMAEHLSIGKGLVYSAGFRTTASTCPLLTLLQAAVLIIVRKPFLCTLLIGMIFSGLAGYIIIFRFCKSRLSISLSTLALTSSYLFMCFTTSGLENCLLFCFGAVILDLFYHNPALNRKQLFIIALMMSLLAMARTDSVLIFIPVAIYAYLFRSKVKFYQRLLLGISGLLPFAGWTLFSLLYYGFPFPNTFYAKVYTGFPDSDYIMHGIIYLFSSWLYDPLLLIIPAAFIFLALKLKNRPALISIIGITVYTVYVIKVGGDFMLGRHLTMQFFLSVCGIAHLASAHDLRNILHFRNKPLSFRYICISSVIVVFLSGAAWFDIVSPILRIYPFNIDTTINSYCSALDERQWYKDTKYTSMGDTISCLINQPTSFDMRMNSDIKKVQKLYLTDETTQGICTDVNKVMLCGYTAYKLSQIDNYYLTDNIALPDPLLSHLHADYQKYWRVGHMTRTIPAGYEETLAKGVNLIEDPSLHEYYDKLLLIMKGDLFDHERIQTIIDLNSGKYDHLIEEYENRKLSS